MLGIAVPVVPISVSQLQVPNGEYLQPGQPDLGILQWSRCLLRPAGRMTVMRLAPGGS
jgi:hypothetical protein